MSTLQRGVWCRYCEWFESGLDFSDGRCLACGCDESLHIPAEVVAS